MLDALLTFIPSGWYTTSYAVALGIAAAICIKTGNKQIALVAGALLVGWFGARLSTVFDSIYPIMIFSIVGGLIAFNVNTRTANIIALLFACKVFVYTASLYASIPIWLMFELSTILGILQIAFLLLGRYGGIGVKGTGWLHAQDHARDYRLSLMGLGMGRSDDHGGTCYTTILDPLGRIKGYNRSNTGQDK